MAAYQKLPVVANNWHRFMQEISGGGQLLVHLFNLQEMKEGDNSKGDNSNGDLVKTNCGGHKQIGPHKAET